uniref:hypothetical protein n=1 Tax=Grateloupia cornea TaxID=176235 RepID=UPI00257A7A28|nr:hypothetical protein QU394_mgp04 [Grateloupia cornea]WIA66142.1 hypothetical protein [Grateloupia cornea]
MRSARLKLHYNYLINFDFTDKESQTQNRIIATPKLNTLVACSKLDQTNSEKHTVLKALVLELFGNQKSLMTKIDKTFSRKPVFKITFRKENLFLFLDSCLNTVFLHEHRSWVWDNVHVENKLHFYLNNSLINNFNIISVQFKYSLQLPNLFTLLNRTNRSRSFYLIPANKTKS